MVQQKTEMRNRKSISGKNIQMLDEYKAERKNTVETFEEKCSEHPRVSELSGDSEGKERKTSIPTG